MEPSAFCDKSKVPHDDEVAEVLGRARGNWDALRAHLAETCDPLIEAWKFSGKKYGWALKLEHKKRAVLYLTPMKGLFRAGAALGDKAVAAARESDLPPDVVEAIDSAKKYMEGRPVRIEVRNEKDLAVVKKIAAIKLAN
ncbi:MAG: DUF3788 domain-containing protein [Planctomycetota bacterium]|jgi:hypothetical protein